MWNMIFFVRISAVTITAWFFLMIYCDIPEFELLKWSRMWRWSIPLPKISTGWKLKNKFEFAKFDSFLQVEVLVWSRIFKGIRCWCFGRCPCPRSKPEKGRELKQFNHGWKMENTILGGGFVFLRPPSLTWNLKISPWKRKVHLKTIIFRFHVKFRGCKYNFHPEPWGHDPIWRAYVSNGSVQPPARI